jgi:hypothetical protein
MIILVSGWIKSGKDTFAELLQKEYNFTQVAFADSLKTYVASKYKIPVSWCYTHEGKDSIIKKVGMTVRQVLIKESERIKEINPFHWVNATIYSIRSCPNVVISDFRFPVEVNRLKQIFPERHIVTVRINRFEKALSAHFTEHALDDYDFDIIVDNIGTPSEFETNIRNVMDFLGQKPKNYYVN